MYNRKNDDSPYYKNNKQLTDPLTPSSPGVDSNQMFGYRKQQQNVTKRLPYFGVKDDSTSDSKDYNFKTI